MPPAYPPPNNPESLDGMRVLVVGLGRFGGGVGVTRWLVEQGATVTVTDLADAASLEASLDAIADLPVTLHLGGHDAVELDTTDLVVLNPAVDKKRSPLFAKAISRNLPWTTEANLFVTRCPARYVAVTGSFGKSTTCAMLATAIESCRNAGDTGLSSLPIPLRSTETDGGRSTIDNRSVPRPDPRYGMGHPESPDECARDTGIGNVLLGGNIGRSLLPDLSSMTETDVVVLEVSNFQLEDWPADAKPADVAVITNVWPHHMDRYDAFAEYVEVKLRLADVPARQVVLGPLHPEAEKMAARKIAQTPDRWHRVAPFDPLPSLVVPGPHNVDNANCVLTICRCLGLNEQTARAALATFTGLPHRLEVVTEVDGVLFCNDSKSTSPNATMVAIKSIDRPIVAMVGGMRKSAKLTACAELLKSRCRAVVCFGEAGPDFAEALGRCSTGTDEVTCEVKPTLADGVNAARALAQRGDVVLFSPGAPSFDEHVNYVARGNRFAELVLARPIDR